ncbi:hypothetical protein Tco_1142420 [Tanacetum coccineum]
MFVIFPSKVSTIVVLDLSIQLNLYQLRSFKDLFKGRINKCQLSTNDKADFEHNGAKESKVSEIITSVFKVKTSNSESSNDKVEMPKNKTVRMSEPIIEEWESDSEDDEMVVKPKENFGRFSHPNPKSNIVPQAVLTKSGLVSLNTAKSVSTAQSRTRMNDAMQKPYSIYKAYSSDKRPFNKKTANHNRYFNKRVNTVKKAEVNIVKTSAGWVWKPKHEELDHVSKSNSASKTLARYDYVDALGRFKSVLAWDFKRH